MSMVIVSEVGISLAIRMGSKKQCTTMEDFLSELYFVLNIHVFSKLPIW